MIKGLLFISIVILLFAVIIQQIAKFVLRKFYSVKPIEKNDPYIAHHTSTMQNDEPYEEYLEWTKNKEVYGAPVKKIEAVEEIESSKKVKHLVPRRKFTDDDNLFL